MASNGSLKLMCYFATKNSWIIAFQSFFFIYFFHNSCSIIINEIWTLQNSKSQYIHQFISSNVSYKLILAKIILHLCYQKFMNDILPIILFHSFFFIIHVKSYSLESTQLFKHLNSYYSNLCTFYMEVPSNWHFDHGNFNPWWWGFQTGAKAADP